MTARASDLAARLHATATHARPAVAPEPLPLAATSAAPRPATRADKPARFTVELPRTQHRFLKRFALEADSDASAVTRALLSLLEADPALAERVHAMLG